MNSITIKPFSTSYTHHTLFNSRQYQNRPYKFNLNPNKNPFHTSISNTKRSHLYAASSSSRSFLPNGSLTMAFLTVKSTAKHKFTPFVAKLAANPTFRSGLIALCMAQSMKMLLKMIVERKWDIKMLFACGGMPSAHSALCVALTTSVGICHGVSDCLFPVSLGFSLVVMYDAIGVRRHAGLQAQVLNKIIADLFKGHPISERKLKELLGHTPSQVFAGALLGIVVACYCCQGCMVPI